MDQSDCGRSVHYFPRVSLFIDWIQNIIESDIGLNTIRPSLDTTAETTTKTVVQRTRAVIPIDEYEDESNGSEKFSIKVIPIVISNAFILRILF